MKFTTKFATGAAIALAATSAFAQVAVPPGAPYNGLIPTGPNAGAFLTLFSTNDATPFAYEYYLGLNFNDLLPSNGMNTPGLTLTWNIAGLSTAVPGTVAASDLAFHVTATSQTGNIATAGGYKVLSTADQSVTLATITGTPTLSSDVQAVQGNSNTFIGAMNATTTNPRTTVSTTDGNYANAFYGTTLNQWGWSAATNPSKALNFFELVSGAGGGTNATVTQFAGTWALNIANGTLIYSVPGGSVPLPAALWLLLSGLAGVGVLSRRKDPALSAVGA